MASCVRADLQKEFKRISDIPFRSLFIAEDGNVAKRRNIKIQYRQHKFVGRNWTRRSLQSFSLLTLHFTIVNNKLSSTSLPTNFMLYIKPAQFVTWQNRDGLNLEQSKVYYLIYNKTYLHEALTPKLFHTKKFNPKNW